MQEVRIRDEYIKLEQAMKLAGAVSMGSEAKMVIQAGKVLVNSKPLTPGISISKKSKCTSFFFRKSAMPTVFLKVPTTFKWLYCLIRRSIPIRAKGSSSIIKQFIVVELRLLYILVVELLATA